MAINAAALPALARAACKPRTEPVGSKVRLSLSTEDTIKLLRAKTEVDEIIATQQNELDTIWTLQAVAMAEATLATTDALFSPEMEVDEPPSHADFMEACD